ncbi:hypothetical protein HRG_003260 [Hirsutella rhossiliensis]|uniref:Uncharacterized protein n=1 Tax=Hirsutella rhossiliensis TaxID=111463 RepID=A0A9P8N1P8_9HYPO|nr:uncharacterized protein HRG_03260 [Hirsutella rhossiliensis]KAH0965244.1 hypothetical protein HRG_03260 [Hirsutella rhossiliensis]
MPCCIGIIDYAQCRHSTLYKLGCTAGCEELCAPAQQEVLLRTRFRWRCEECHALRYATDADARTERWNDQARRIIDKDKGGCGGGGDDGCNDNENDKDEKGKMNEGRAQRDGARDAREMRVLALRDREEFEEQLQEERRVAQVEEIQYAEEWTNQYGRAVFAMRYGPRGRRRRRLRQWWLRQEEEQRSEEEDDEADGPVEAERRPRAEDTPEDDDHLHLHHHHHHEQQQQQQQQLEDIDDNEQQEAARRQIEKLRSVQQWDLVILRDALRSDKELRELRDEAQRLGRGGRDDLGHCGIGFGFGSRALPAAEGWPTMSGRE